MSGKRLQIIDSTILSPRQKYEMDTRTYWDSCWSGESHKYDPQSTLLGKERIARTFALLESEVLDGKNLVDLGCGTAPLAPYLKGANLLAIDVSKEVLNKVPNYVKTSCGCLPYCHLAEENFDGALLLDVLADLEPHLFRITLSEIAALLKKESFFLCSTEIDLHSEDALGEFLSLIQTEFEVVRLKKSYHRLYFYSRRWLDAPARFFRSGKEISYRLKQLEKRRGFFRLWFYVNSLKWISYLWSPFIFLKKSMRSRSSLLLLERLSKVLWREGAVTHVIVFCRRKSLHS